MSTKLLGFLSLITALLFGALIALQVVELKHYSADPSVWPAAQ